MQRNILEEQSNIMSYAVARPFDELHFMDRRRHPRFRLHSTVFLFTRPLVVKTAIISNISLGGLAFSCAAFEQPPAGACQVDLLACELDQYLRLEGLCARMVAGPVPVGLSAKTALHGSRREKPLLMVDCRLRFQGLATRQKRGLEFLLRNYTRAAA